METRTTSHAGKPSDDAILYNPDGDTGIAGKIMLKVGEFSNNAIDVCHGRSCSYVLLFGGQVNLVPTTQQLRAGY